ncbi:hypothetical protein PVAND_002855 [Polypedilum vanderplanki]|uniref:Major facilitator superfamily (MFS) profile domain-containing protein n=1 Tax=Polypedilum vanderplanki TaxID=319348 RepID=A0A9J6BTY3_POLVA|nr:hypothetical protein PVAND_002855 [Polypedilum vanderplanki]
MSEKQNFDLDEVLDKEIKFGKYQIIIFVLIAFPITLNGVYSSAYIFTAGNLNYRCKIPECDLDNGMFHETWVNFSIPFDNESPQKCKKFQYITNDNMSCMANSFNPAIIESCDNFIYEDDEITIQNEFGLNCNKEFYLSLIGTINNIGQLFCYLITGFISDKYGRKIIIILGCIGNGVFGVLRVFSNNYYVFATFEFLDALFGSATYAAAYIIGLELVTPQLRTISGTILNCFYALGGMILGLVAMWLRNYKSLLFVTYIPAFIVIAYTWLLPQSIRWLLSEGRHEDAKIVLRKACKLNGTEMSVQTLNSLDEKIQMQNSNNNTLESASKSEKISIRAVLQITNLSYCWFATIFVYYGLNLNSVYLEYWNKYINFIFVCAIELPGYFITNILMEKLGRKKTLFLGMIGSGLFCILADVVPGSVNKTIFYVCGKLLITISFSCLYIFTIEIFPTSLRQRFFSICSIVGRLGSILTMSTPLLIEIYPSLPLILFSSLSFSSAIFLWSLPETLNRRLPETMKEAFN